MAVATKNYRDGKMHQALVVDDNLFFAKGIVSALAKSGFEAIIARFCASGLEVNASRHGKSSTLLESRQKEDCDMQERMNEIVQAISLVETRDPYSPRHQRRVSGLACAIARKMSLSEWKVNNIRIAGLLHDVGKITLPADILNKPDRLNAHEFSIIKSHPEVGYDILKMLRLPGSVNEAVLQHHERLDGSGYPRGLCGMNIILGARILAVADVVEAMSSERSYHPALGVDSALREISQGRVVLYDAEVVDTCLKLFQEGFGGEWAVSNIHTLGGSRRPFHRAKHPVLKQARSLSRRGRED